MTDNVEVRSFYKTFLRPLEEEGQLAWSAYLFNVEKARALAAILSQDQARKMLRPVGLRTSPVSHFYRHLAGNQSRSHHGFVLRPPGPFLLTH